MWAVLDGLRPTCRFAGVSWYPHFPSLGWRIDRPRYGTLIPRSPHLDNIQWSFGAPRQFNQQDSSPSKLARTENLLFVNFKTQ